MTGRIRGFILALALAAAWGASAGVDSYIYWLITDPVLDDGTPLSGSARARFVGYTDTTSWSDGVALQLFTSDGELTLLGDSVEIEDLTWDGEHYAKFEEATEANVRYFVELYNDSDNVNPIWRSAESIDYSTAEDGGMLMQRDSESPDLTPEPANRWEVTRFSSVPEPSSALLTALGLALLALRRRHPHA